MAGCTEITVKVYIERNTISVWTYHQTYNQRQHILHNNYVLKNASSLMRMHGEMLSKLIQHCKSNRLRRPALREPDKSLGLAVIRRHWEALNLPTNRQTQLRQHPSKTRDVSAVRYKPHRGEHVTQTRDECEQRDDRTPRTYYRS